MLMPADGFRGRCCPMKFGGAGGACIGPACMAYRTAEVSKPGEWMVDANTGNHSREKRVMLVGWCGLAGKPPGV